MIRIQKAKTQDLEILALLGRLTWAESHGQYIDDKNDIPKYLNENFSISKTTENLAKGTIVLESGDTLKLKAQTANDIAGIISVLEIFDEKSA